MERSTPELQTSEDKYIMAENNDVTDPCRFKLAATMKERNGVPILANIIFSFGFYKSDKPDLYLAHIKVGGTTAKYWERDVSIYSTTQYDLFIY